MHDSDYNYKERLFLYVSCFTDNKHDRNRHNTIIQRVVAKHQYLHSSGRKAKDGISENGRKKEMLYRELESTLIYFAKSDRYVNEAEKQSIH